MSMSSKGGTYPINDEPSETTFYTRVAMTRCAGR